MGVDRPEPGRVGPASHPSRRTILATSPEAVAKVIAEDRARSAALGLYLWLVMVTGVRRGELCGLQIRDIDLDRALVHVAFNYVVRGGRRTDRPWRCYRPDHPAGNTAGQRVPLVLRPGLEFLLLEFSFG